VVTESEVDQYLETALWIGTTDDVDGHGGDPLDEHYSIDDFSPESRAKARADLEDFNAEMERVLEAIGDERFDLDLGNWAHDFYLNRNGHGVGFWSEPQMYGSVAEALSALAHRAGEVYVYEGDDGQVHLS
jgi:hypothetical protein